MPYRTPHGRKYHATMGCHGATLPCGTGGLSPCWYCDAGLREQRRRARQGKAGGTPIGGMPSASSSGDVAQGGSSSATESVLTSRSPMMDAFERVRSSGQVTFPDHSEHWHEERFGVPAAIMGEGMADIGIGSLSDLREWAAGRPGIIGDVVTDLVDRQDLIGALAVACASTGASTIDGFDPDGGWAVLSPEDAETLVADLRTQGRGKATGFRLPGNLRLVSIPGSGAIDIGRGRGEMTPADIALAISCTRRSANGPYQLLHYDQLACYNNGHMDGMNSMWEAYEGFLTELRGTVYDTRDMSIVSNPYYKFRNLNECDDYSEANVRAAIAANGGRMVATEKLDGSLIQMRYVAEEDREGGAWRNGMLVTTSNTLEGSDSASENSHLINVEHLHVQSADDSRYRDLARAYPDKTLCFEFIRPEVDPHVVSYDQEKWGMWLTGMRDVSTGRLATHEEVAEAAERFGIPHPEVIATDLDECLRVVQEGDGSRMEGMVVDVDGWLVKMKLTDFLSLSHIHHSLEGARGFKDVLRMAHEGTLDDAMSNIPEPSRIMIDGIVARASAYQAGMEAAIDSVMEHAPNPADGRREYAQWVMSQPIPRRWQKYLFARADGKEPPVYYADSRSGSLSYIGRNELAEREAELANWLESRRHG